MEPWEHPQIGARGTTKERIPPSFRSQELHASHGQAVTCHHNPEAHSSGSPPALHEVRDLQTLSTLSTEVRGTCPDRPGDRSDPDQLIRRMLEDLE